MKEKDIESLQHITWRWQCHIVFALKYHRMSIVVHMPFLGFPKPPASPGGMTANSTPLKLLRCKK